MLFKLSVIVYSLVTFGLIGFLIWPMWGEDIEELLQQIHLRPVQADFRQPFFFQRLNEGASCRELIAIRDAYRSDSELLSRMNDQLQLLGCSVAPPPVGRRSNELRGW